MSGSNCSVEFNVGDLKELISVELPCFVKTSKTALEMLGGDVALQSAFESNTISSSIQVRFPTKDQTRHNIQGAQIGRHGILLKMRRKRSDPDNIRVEVLGFVNKSFVFNNPTDYQFMPVSSDTAFYSSRGNFPNKPTLEIIPQSFCRTQNTKGVQFLNLYENLKPVVSAQQAAYWKSNPPSQDTLMNANLSPSAAKEAAKAARIALGERKKHPDAGLTAFIRFQDDIPTSHPSGDYPLRWKVRAGQQEHRGVQIINQLRELFQIIPMMSMFQLKGIINVPAKFNYLFKDCLPYVAFCYSQGPYRGLWVRFGYNPRAHPESRLFQSITFRLAPAVFQEVSTLMFNHIGPQRAVDRIVDLDTLLVRDISASELGISGKAQHGKMPFAIFGRALKHQFNLQLYLLTDDAILAYVSRMKTQPSCNHNNGWYTQTAMSGLRNLVLKTMSDRIDQFLAVQQPVFRRGPIVNPTSQALLESFNAQEVINYLNAPWREGGDGDDMESDQLHSEEALAPSAQLYWLKKYTQTSPLSYGDGDMQLLHEEGSGGDEEQEQDREERGRLSESSDSEEEEEEVNKTSKSAPSSSSKKTRKVRYSSAARSEASTIRRDKVLAPKRKPPTISKVISDSQHVSAATVPSTKASFNFNDIEAFDVFGQDDEEEEEEDQDDMMERDSNDSAEDEDENEFETHDERRYSDKDDNAMDVGEDEGADLDWEGRRDSREYHQDLSAAAAAVEQAGAEDNQIEVDSFMHMVQQARKRNK